MAKNETNHKGPTTAPSAPGGREKAAARKDAGGKQSAPKRSVAAKAGKTETDALSREAKKSKKPEKPRRTDAAAPRADSKSGKIMEMINRANGATLTEIVRATAWQAHSVRGFLSTATKKHRIRVESVKNENGERIYRVVK